MDLKQIEYFIRVAELSSFTRASIELNVAQPALSRQVRLLEVELQQTLLLRNGRGVTTTEAGLVMLEQGRGILHQVERAREELGRVRGALTGKVAVGLPPSLSKLLAVPLVREFARRMPDASLSITEGLSVTMQESLISGRLDLTLLYNARATPDIDNQLLLEEPLFLVSCKRAHGSSAPITLSELAKQPLVIPSRPHALRMQVEAALAKLDLQPQIAFEIDAVTAILDLVADGAGAAVLSQSAVRFLGESSTLTARPITSPRLHSKLSLAVSAHRPITLAQKSTQELIRHIVRTHCGPQAPARTVTASVKRRKTLP
ncbi:MAG: LysR substrate-binding domain-containing protein [Rhodanobacter sp.]